MRCWSCYSSEVQLYLELETGSTTTCTQISVAWLTFRYKLNRIAWKCPDWLTTLWNAVLEKATAERSWGDINCLPFHSRSGLRQGLKYSSLMVRLRGLWLSWAATATTTTTATSESYRTLPRYWCIHNISVEHGVLTRVFRVFQRLFLDLSAQQFHQFCCRIRHLLCSGIYGSWTRCYSRRCGGLRYSVHPVSIEDLLVIQSRTVSGLPVRFPQVLDWPSSPTLKPQLWCHYPSFGLFVSS